MQHAALDRHQDLDVLDRCSCASHFSGYAAPNIWHSYFLHDEQALAKNHAVWIKQLSFKVNALRHHSRPDQLLLYFLSPPSNLRLVRRKGWLELCAERTWWLEFSSCLCLSRKPMPTVGLVSISFLLEQNGQRVLYGDPITALRIHLWPSLLTRHITNLFWFLYTTKQACKERVIEQVCGTMSWFQVIRAFAYDAGTCHTRKL